MAKKRTPQPQVQPKQNTKHKISKKPEQKSHESHHESEKPQIKQKKKPQKPSDFVFFTGAFYDKLHDFNSLYKDFLTVKTASNNGDTTIDTELQETTKHVQQHIQEAASSIFKHQLQETEAWIQSEMQKIDDQNKVIETAYENNRQSLLKTGAFTEEEVRKQLSPIQSKIAAKRETREKYQQLLTRSKQIYE